MLPTSCDDVSTQASESVQKESSYANIVPAFSISALYLTLCPSSCVIISAKMHLYKQLLIVFLSASVQVCVRESSDNALNIVDIVNGTFILNTTNLQTVIGNTNQDEDIAVIAIAGAFRKGKSFLMNLFPQYLDKRSHIKEPIPLSTNDTLQALIESQSHPWLHDIPPDSGFSYKSGTTRHTKGISMWPRAISIEKKDGKRLSVLIVDSQGLYDDQTSGDTDARIFTLIALISSSLIMNEQSNLNSRSIDSLESFLQYASDSANQKGKQKMFQRITYLIRDAELLGSFGWESGQSALDPFLTKTSSSGGLKISEILTNNFEKIDAFAMPGPNVETVFKKDFKGSLAHIGYKYLLYLEKFVSNISEEAVPRKDVNFGFTIKRSSFVSFMTNVVNATNNKMSAKQFREKEITVARGRIETEMDSLLQKYTHFLTDFMALPTYPAWCSESSIESDLKRASSEK
jgi:atlastin